MNANLYSRAPKEDVSATIRKLPERQEARKTTSNAQRGPDLVESRNSLPDKDIHELNYTFSTSPAPAPAKPAAVTPLAPARYKVEFTASAELREKLERLRALMRSSVPDGDLTAIIEER